MYTDRFNSLMQASHWLNIPSLALQCVLLITFIVLPKEVSHGSYHNFGLCIAIILLQVCSVVFFFLLLLLGLSMKRERQADSVISFPPSTSSASSSPSAPNPISAMIPSLPTTCTPTCPAPGPEPSSPRAPWPALHGSCCAPYTHISKSAGISNTSAYSSGWQKSSDGVYLVCFWH